MLRLVSYIVAVVRQTLRNFDDAQCSMVDTSVVLYHPTHKTTNT